MTVLWAIATLTASVASGQQAIAPNPAIKDVLEPRNSPEATKAYDQRSTEVAPVRLEANALHCTFHLQMEEGHLIEEVLRAYRIEAGVDISVTKRIVRFDVDDVGFTEAASLVKLVTATFFVPLDPRHVLVVANTRENRNKYQHLAMETLYIPGLTPTELTDMQNIARNLFGIEHGVAQDKQGKTILRAPDEDLQVMNQAFTELLAGRNEVQLDIHVYEEDRTKDTNAGVILPNSATLFNVRSEAESIIANNSSLVQEIISSGLASAGDYSAILAILLASGEVTGTIFNNPFVIFGGGLTQTGVEWNSVAANMLLSSSDVKSLNEIQLRVQDREEAIFRSGERYPVVTSTYTYASSSSSTTSTTVPQIQYEDLGLTVKITPFVEADNDIALNVDLQLTALAGSTINNMPALSHEQYTGVISLRTGESALVVSAMSQQDEREIIGMPGLSELPGFSNSTNREDIMSSKTLVVVITPHIVRLVHPEIAGTMYLLPLE